MSVSVCLSVCPRAYLRDYICPIFTKLFLRATLTVARSSSSCFGIRHVLPVLWMTSYLHTLGHIVMSIVDTSTFVSALGFIGLYAFWLFTLYLECMGLERRRRE